MVVMVLGMVAVGEGMGMGRAGLGGRQLREPSWVCLTSSNCQLGG